MHVKNSDHIRHELALAKNRRTYVPSLLSIQRNFDFELGVERVGNRKAQFRSEVRYSLEWNVRALQLVIHDRSKPSILAMEPGRIQNLAPPGGAMVWSDLE